MKGAEIYASKVGEGDKLNGLKKMIKELIDSIERLQDLKI